MNDRILGLLGLCRRAGKLTAGNDAVIDDVKNNRSKIVIITEDISKNTEKKMMLACHRLNVKILKLNRSQQELSNAIGKYCTVISVSDSGFAKKLFRLIQEENQEVIVHD